MGHSLFDMEGFSIIFRLICCVLGAAAMIHYGRDITTSVAQTKTLKNTGRPIIMMFILMCAIGIVISFRPSQIFSFFEKPIYWIFSIIVEILRRIGIPL